MEELICDNFTDAPLPSIITRRVEPMYVTPSKANFSAGVAAAKRLGGKFLGYLKVWEIPDGNIDFESYSDLQSKLTAQNLQVAETKTCWECGCIMTYSLCKAQDGDWRDDYCGC